MSRDQKSCWRFLTKLDPRWRCRSAGVAADSKSSRRRPFRRSVFWICAFFSTVGVGLYLRAEIHRRVIRLTDDSVSHPAYKGGTLLIAGGGQLSRMITQRFVELAGNQQARIVVIPASEIVDSELVDYRERWLAYGVKSVDVLHADSRIEADDPEFSRILDVATGVWLGGGTQTWLAGLYGRTRVESRLKELLSRNGVIAGTSAGAAVMSGVMIAGGREKPPLARGFGLIPGAIIDQHFVKRNRIRRLQYALEQNPDLIGFGIDEGAALQYSIESGRFRVIGTSCVVACVPYIDSDQRAGLNLEFLNPGLEFDIERLRHGEAVPPSYYDLESILIGE